MDAANGKKIMPATTSKRLGLGHLVPGLSLQVDARLHQNYTSARRKWSI